MNDFLPSQNRRYRIREEFEEQFRYHQVPPTPPLRGSPLPLPTDQLPAEMAQVLQDAATVARVLTGRNPQNMGELLNAVTQLQGLLQEIQAHSPSRLPPRGPAVPAHHQPIVGAHHHGEHLAHILRHLRFPEEFCQHFENMANATLWLDTPIDPEADAILRTIARDFFPNGTSHQEGLQTTFNSPEAQSIFQGGQILQGATLLHSTAQLIALLLPFTNVTQQSMQHLVNTLGLAPFLIGNNAQSALLTGALASQAQKGNTGSETLPFLQSLGSLLISQGVSPGEITPHILSILGQISGVTNGQVPPALLQQWISKLGLAIQPQTLGLNQSLQGGQSTSLLNQLFNSILKVFAGVLLMNNQLLWPQATPNDAMLASLAALLATQAKKAEEAKKRKKVKRKGQTEEHERIEAKEDLEDDTDSSHLFELLIPEEEEKEEEIIDVEFKELEQT